MGWTYGGKSSEIILRFTILLPCFVCICHASVATWMYLGLVGSNFQQDTSGVVTVPRKGFYTEDVAEAESRSPVAEWCNSLSGLVAHQIALCKRSPRVFWQVKDAAKLAIKECQNQFHNERWNCTTTNDRRVFGKTIMKGNRETAFITAISSAAVVHAVVRACSSGNLSECSCDLSKQGQHHPGSADVGPFKWAGCTDNVQFGLWFSRQFNDAPEEIKRKDTRNVKDAMNLHNKAAGRSIIHSRMQLQCRCHGVSGSCEVKTCWRIMSPFREIGAALKREYDSAVPIAKKYVSKLRRRGKSVKMKKNSITNEDLVYLEKSPDYCNFNPTRGIIGTSGRPCNATSTGPEGCTSLCCGRGYNTHITRKSERCQCKFVWCCQVQCKTCSVRSEVHSCK